MTKKLQRFFGFAAFAAFVFLTGCAVAPPPPVNYSVPNVGISRVKLDAELRSINVSYANQREATGKIPATAVRTPELWKSALEGALNNMVVFRDDAMRKVNLMVKITRFEPAESGIDMVANAEARYDIVDRSNGDIIYSQNVSTSGKMTMGENINGLARIIEATNIAVRNNIATFLQSLETVDMSKPMFPANLK